MAVIRGESCFEKNAFEDTENPHPPTKTRLPGPVVQTPISANPGLTLNKTYGVNSGLALIGF